MQNYETSRWKLQEAQDGWAERGREDTYPKDTLEQESGLGHGVTEDVLWARNLTDVFQGNQLWYTKRIPGLELSRKLSSQS